MPIQRGKLLPLQLHSRRTLISITPLVYSMLPSINPLRGVLVDYIGCKIAPSRLPLPSTSLKRTRSALVVTSRGFFCLLFHNLDRVQVSIQVSKARGSGNLAVSLPHERVPRMK